MFYAYDNKVITITVYLSQLSHNSTQVFDSSTSLPGSFTDG